MSKFAKPKARYDRAKAQDGVWFYIDDEMGNDWGGFKCTLFDRTLPKCRLAVERVERRHANKGKKKDDAQYGAEMFVETCLVDWDVNGPDGKSVKFTKENALEYFTDNEVDDETGEKVYTYDFVFSKLFALVRDVTNFQSDEQNEAGDAAGN